RSVDLRRSGRGAPSVSDLMRVDPQRLTTVREAYDQALNDLGNQLNRLRIAGHVDSPWLGDHVSGKVQTHYNATVMDSPAGAYQAMRKYEEELKAVRDRIAEMEQAYLAGERANTELAPRVEA
ncbi:MAG: hypothetical protein ACRDXB_20135, partial [Actinomycetes bacterium]